MTRDNIRETGLTIASVVTAVGGLALAYVVGNHVDNGHLLNDLVSWNTHVDPMLNITKYWGEAVGTLVVGGASYFVPSLIDLGVSYGKLQIARRRTSRALRQW